MQSLPRSGEWKQGNEGNLNEFHDCFCPNCGGGKAHTILLPTNIPMFREIYIVTLNCPECHFKNTEVNFGGEIQSKGCRTALVIQRLSDLNRQVIKADSATIYIPSIQLEIPPNAQRGAISTVEGILLRASDHLESLQSTRLQLGDVDNFHRCHTVINKLRYLAGDEEGDSHGARQQQEEDSEYPSFEFIIDDPSGNSFIESIQSPTQDNQITKEYYVRTPAQDLALGLQPSDSVNSAKASVKNNLTEHHGNAINMNNVIGNGDHRIELDKNMRNGTTLGKDEALTFRTKCASCLKDAETKMCIIQIPHFKDVIIMSMNCDKCGYKSNEIKGGGGIPNFGTRIILTVHNPDDLAREVLKSDSAGISIPELDFEMEEGGLGGIYTTVEGLLQKIGERLAICNPFHAGDAATKQHETNDGETFSLPSSSTMRYREFLERMEQMRQGRKLPFTLCVDDPLSNSFIGPIPKVAVQLGARAEKDGHNQCIEEYVDPGIQMEEYTRSWDQNERLGLNDIKTENYERLKGRGGTSVGDLGPVVGHEYYGTDSPNEVPDRLRFSSHVRGPDHPHETAKGSSWKEDLTVMGEGSSTYADPSCLLNRKDV